MYHTVIVAGHLGNDPEMRMTPTGDAVVNMSVATNNNTKNTAGEWVKQPIWFRVSVFGKRAESCNKFLHKGSKVLVEGTLKPDESGSPKIFQRQDGTNGSSYEINASRVTLLSAASEDVSPNTDEVTF
jgi:single-strand DNA-binding protein